MGRDVAFAALIEEGVLAESMGQAVAVRTLWQRAVLTLVAGHASTQGVPGGIGADKVEGLAVAGSAGAIDSFEVENHRHWHVGVVALPAGGCSRVIGVRIMTIIAFRHLTV